MKLPKIGDKIYVPTALHISEGSRDIHGGLATISKIDINKRLPEDHCNKIFISVKEIPNRGFNYRLLMEDQEKLKKEFGETIAYPDPDIDTPWIQDGDIVDGKIYHGPPIW